MSVERRSLLRHLDLLAEEIHAAEDEVRRVLLV